MDQWNHGWKNDIEISSTHNKGKYDIAKRFIKTLKKEIYKHMNAVSKNVYTNKIK